jgi:hypothetical protein
VRRAPALILTALTCGGLAALAADRTNPPDRAATAGATKGVKGPKLPEFTPEREAAALTFVGRHHPELVDLLHELKPVNASAYEQAVGEIFQVSETLADLRPRDPRRAALGLEAWKAKSRVQLLTAQLAGDPGPAPAPRLRAALEAQVDVQIRQQRLDLEQAEARVRKVRENLHRLEQQRDVLVEARFKKLLKAARQPPRRPDAGRPDPAPPARSPGRPKA